MGKENVKLSRPDIKTYYNPSIIGTVWNRCANGETSRLKMRASAEPDPGARGANCMCVGQPLGPGDKGDFVVSGAGTTG